VRTDPVVATVALEFLWRPSEHADECATHPLAVAEAGRIRHLFGEERAWREGRIRRIFVLEPRPDFL
jgi:hypothetical protein